jgi:hypothetical protein
MTDPYVNLYTDPEKGFVGAAKLIPKMDPPLTKEGIANLFRHADKIQMNRKPRKPKKYLRITGPPYSFQIDVMDLQGGILRLPHFNKITGPEFPTATAEAPSPTARAPSYSLRYVLVVIDILSRKAFLYPLRNRKQPTIVAAFQLFVAEVKRQLEDVPVFTADERLRRPDAEHMAIRSITGDNDFFWPGFTRACAGVDPPVTCFTDVAKESHATHGDRLGIVDRFIRTFKAMLRMYIDVTRGKRYVDAMRPLVDNYNDTRHSALLGHTPDEAFTDPDLLRAIRAENNRQNDAVRAEERVFPVGTPVRAVVTRNLFDKEKFRFSQQVFRVHERDHNRYRLCETRGRDHTQCSTVLKRRFKPIEIMPVDPRRIIPLGQDPAPRTSSNADGDSPPPPPPRKRPQSGSPTYSDAQRQQRTVDVLQRRDGLGEGQVREGIAVANEPLETRNAKRARDAQSRVKTGTRVDVAFAVGTGLEWFAGTVASVHGTTTDEDGWSLVTADIRFDDGDDAKNFKLFDKYFERKKEAGWRLAADGAGDPRPRGDPAPSGASAALKRVRAGTRAEVMFKVGTRLAWFRGTIASVRDIANDGDEDGWGATADIDFDDGTVEKGFRLYDKVFGLETEAGWRFLPGSGGDGVSNGNPSSRGVAGSPARDPLPRRPLRTNVAEKIHCDECGRAGDGKRMLQCDGCERWYHVDCLKPPLGQIPETEWFCKHCVRASSSRDSGSGPAESSDGRPAASKAPSTKSPHSGLGQSASSRGSPPSRPSSDVTPSSSSSPPPTAPPPPTGAKRKVRMTLPATATPCAVCATTDGKKGSMLACAGCDARNHTHCTRPPLDRKPRGDWYCERCRRLRQDDAPCVVCGSTDARKDGKPMFYCDVCHRGFHEACVGEDIDRATGWICPDHRRKSAKPIPPRPTPSKSMAKPAKTKPVTKRPASKDAAPPQPSNRPRLDAAVATVVLPNPLGDAAASKRSARPRRDAAALAVVTTALKKSRVRKVVAPPNPSGDATASKKSARPRRDAGALAVVSRAAPRLASGPKPANRPRREAAVAAVAAVVALVAPRPRRRRQESSSPRSDGAHQKKRK